MKNTIKNTNDTEVTPAEKTSTRYLQTDGSRFQLINLASQRCKQLMRGSRSRIVDDGVKHKNTSIAIQEVRQHLIAFTTMDDLANFEPRSDGRS